MRDRRDEFAKEPWLWKTYGEGIRDALKLQPGRDFRLIHRYHQTLLSPILEAFKPYPSLFDLSFKYSVAHMLSSPAPPFAKESLEELPANMRMWMTVRNDDIYSFRWADPEFARAYVKNLPGPDKLAGFYMGPDGTVSFADATWGQFVNHGLHELGPSPHPGAEVDLRHGGGEHREHDDDRRADADPHRPIRLCEIGDVRRAFARDVQQLFTHSRETGRGKPLGDTVAQALERLDDAVVVELTVHVRESGIGNRESGSRNPRDASRSESDIPRVCDSRFPFGADQLFGTCGLFVISDVLSGQHMTFANWLVPPYIAPVSHE